MASLTRPTRGRRGICDIFRLIRVEGQATRATRCEPAEPDPSNATRTDPCSNGAPIDRHAPRTWDEKVGYAVETDISSSSIRSAVL